MNSKRTSLAAKFFYQIHILICKRISDGHVDLRKRFFDGRVDLRKHFHPENLNMDCNFYKFKRKATSLQF